VGLGGGGVGPSEAFYECAPGAASRALPGTYVRRNVEATLLHRVVRENLATFLLESGQRGGLPSFVQQDFCRYLDCGVLAKGFARVACKRCKNEILVAFSCKGRGTCPSCNARRAHDASIHLVDNVLPHAPYRQWTLSFPMPLRFLLAKDARLFSRVLSLFVRTLFAFFRRRARALGIPKPLPGAVAFLQRFGSALQLTPHIHLLAIEGAFAQDGPESAPVRFHRLPPPGNRDVEVLLRKVVLRTIRLLGKKAPFEKTACEQDALDLLSADAVRTPRLPFFLQGPPKPAGRRCAFLEGFSLHANTSVHANNRDGLLKLANYGARGPLSLERLCELPDGNLAYRMKRPSSSGASVLLLKPIELLRKLAALVPPPRTNLLRYFGVLASNSGVRRLITPCAVSPAATAPGVPEAQPAEKVQLPATVPRRTRVPWADLLKRTFATDILSCKCGGRRRVVAYVVAPSTTREILQHLGLPDSPPPLAKARAPPQLDLYG